MPSPDLLIICVSAFIAVFLLLTFLAVVMRVLISIYPDRAVGTDAAIIAAVTSVASLAYPGAKVTKVEEIP